MFTPRAGAQRHPNNSPLRYCLDQCGQIESRVSPAQTCTAVMSDQRAAPAFRGNSRHLFFPSRPSSRADDRKLSQGAVNHAKARCPPRTVHLIFPDVACLPRSVGNWKIGMEGAKLSSTHRPDKGNLLYPLPIPYCRTFPPPTLSPRPHPA